MATKELVTKVWIEPGCIVCDACENTCPEVFEVTETTCLIRPPALSPDFTKPITESIKDAAAECPVDVIKYETVLEEVPDDAAAPAPAAAPAVAATSAPAAAHAAQPAAAAKVPAAPAHASAAPVPAVAAKAPDAPVKTSVAGEPDPAIAALLRAATSRGGQAGILKKGDSVPETVQAWRSKDVADLPPDARQARVLEEARKQRKDPDATRRALVGSAALAGAWIAMGAYTGISLGAFTRFMMPNVLEEPDPRIRVGKLSKYVEMAPNEVNEDYKPQGIWMIREEGQIAALNIICTHLGCIPNWLPNDRKFKCPCHGSGYYPNGINFEGPTPRPLERFKLGVVGGMVVVDKSKKYQYELGQWTNPDSYLTV